MDHVNMIDLRVFSAPNFNEPLFPNLQITFVNGDGRVIISWLDIKYLIITWTLSAGRTRYDLHVRESRTGCIQTMENRRDFVSASLLKRFIGSTSRTDCEVCYVEGKVNQLPNTRTCCKMTENDQSKYECDVDKYRNDVLNLVFFPNIPVYITLMGFVFVVIFCCPFFVQTSLTHQNNNTYYYLTESTMSIPCIVRYIVSEDHGKAISKIRRFVFVILTSILYTLHFWQHLEGRQIYLNYFFIYWVIFFPFTKLLNGVVLSEDDQRLHILKGTPFICLSKFMSLYLQYDIRGLHSSRITDLHSPHNTNLLLLISLPFNIKKWYETIKKLYCVLDKVVISGLSRNYNCNSVPKYAVLWLFTTFVCLVYIPVVFVMLIILIITTICAYMHKKFKIVVHSDSKQATRSAQSRYQTLRHMHEALILILSIFFFGVIFLFSWIPLYLGLFANLIYFIPYITVVSVSTFYSLQFWKSMDSKYFALKMFIYEEYRERTSENNDDLGIQSSSQKESGEIVPVLPRELYHKIRERLLPYHTNLWFHGLQVFAALYFLGFFVYMIMMLQRSHATSSVKVITTMSVSVLPYIYNSVVLKSSEEQKRAGDERLKINVKRVVDELIAEDPELATTVLTIRPYKNETTGVQRSDNEDSTEHDETSVCIVTEPRDSIQYETSM
ncbi:Hypothetical predicted protein [Paramuricea clavata]|nr:Hypothetical predicted protein [Paramuricea clavata]